MRWMQRNVGLFAFLLVASLAVLAFHFLGFFAGMDARILTALKAAAIINFILVIIGAMQR